MNDGYLGSGRRLHASVAKHGKTNHVRQVLEMFEDRKSLSDRERQLVNQDMLKDSLCMNIVEGGTNHYDQNGIWIGKLNGHIHQEKFKNDAAYRENYLQKLSEGQKRRHTEGRGVNPQDVYDWTGKRHKQETIEKMKLSHRGKHDGAKNSQFGTCWVTKDSVVKKIKYSELAQFVSDGWTRGRKIIGSSSSGKDSHLISG